ncbi:MAG: DUF3108 domain-containing protein [Prevotellaceae bacterium]|jgi:hypothetical protein|nr:DUF3108 domain-containing protein [Prevotellaceae bacterium]
MEQQHAKTPTRIIYIALLRVLSLLATVTMVSHELTAQDSSESRKCDVIFTEDNYAFQDREEATYLANYKWGLISTDVGEATIRINRIINANVPNYFVEVTAKTYKFYDRVFKVRDTYTSRFNAETFLPEYFHRNVFEGGYTKRSTLTFDWKKKELKSITQRKKNPAVDTILSLQDCTFDLLSLLFYSRNLDFTFVEPGDVFPMVFALDDEIYNLKYRYIGKETVSIDLGNFRCLKFGIQVVAGDVFKGDEEVTLWVTDDRNHLPIKAESPIIVGKVRITLTKMNNIKHPLTSMS